MIAADIFYFKRTPGNGRSYSAELVTAGLAGALPGNPVMVIAVGIVVLGALYWLVRKRFDEFDCMPTPQIRFGGVEALRDGS